MLGNLGELRADTCDGIRTENETQRRMLRLSDRNNCLGGQGRITRLRPIAFIGLSRVLNR